MTNNNFKLCGLAVCMAFFQLSFMINCDDEFDAAVFTAENNLEQTTMHCFEVMIGSDECQHENQATYNQAIQNAKDELEKCRD